MNTVMRRVIVMKIKKVAMTKMEIIKRKMKRMMIVN